MKRIRSAIQPPTSNLQPPVTHEYSNPAQGRLIREYILFTPKGNRVTHSVERGPHSVVQARQVERVNFPHAQSRTHCFTELYHCLDPTATDRAAKTTSYSHSIYESRLIHPALCFEHRHFSPLHTAPWRLACLSSAAAQAANLSQADLSRPAKSCQPMLSCKGS